MHDKKGFFALLLNALFLGTYGIWVRLLQNTFTASQQVVGRSVISFLGAIIIVFFLKSHWKIQKKYNSHLAFYLISFALSTLFFTISVIQTSIALSVFSLYIGSIISAFILGIFWFQERINRKKLVSILFVIFAFLAFIIPHSSNVFNLGFIMGIISGIFDGIGNGFKKYFGGKIERPVLIVFQLFSTLLLALLTTIFIREPFTLSTITVPHALVMLIYGGLFLAVSYLSMYGFQHFHLNLGTIIISTELFWAPFFAFLIFHETLTLYEIIGGLCLAAAILISYVTIHRDSFIINFLHNI